MQEKFQDKKAVTKSEIAKELGISLSTLKRKLKKENVNRLVCK